MEANFCGAKYSTMLSYYDAYMHAMDSGFDDLRLSKNVGSYDEICPLQARVDLRREIVDIFFR